MVEIFAIPYPIIKTKYAYPRSSEGLGKEWQLKTEEAVLKAKGSQTPPGYVLFTEDEQHHLDARTLIDTGEQKDLLVAIAKGIAKKIKAIGSVFIAEDWLALATPEEGEQLRRGKEFRPSQSPNRQECLLVVAEYIGMKPVTVLSTMVRDTSGIVTSFRPALIPGGMKMEGRFADILDYDVSRG